MEGGGVNETSFKAAMKGDGKYLVITPLVILLPVCYWYFTAPPLGYCAEKKWLLTDAEYIEFAVPKGLQRGQKITDGKPVINCCSVDRTGGMLRQVDSFVSKLFRFDTGVEVSWTYELSEEGKKITFAGAGDTKYAVIQVVDSCATKLFESAGTATN